MKKMHKIAKKGSPGGNAGEGLNDAMHPKM